VVDGRMERNSGGRTHRRWRRGSTALWNDLSHPRLLSVLRTTHELPSEKPAVRKGLAIGPPRASRSTVGLDPRPRGRWRPKQGIERPRSERTSGRAARTHSPPARPPGRTGLGCLPRARVLAGLRTREHSGLTGFLLSAASQFPKVPVHGRISFSLTAAGQSRNHTGFPIGAEPRGSTTSTGRTLNPTC
jgi:hypothetical protein